MNDLVSVQAIERNSSAVLQEAARTAEALARAAETDERYDELAAIAAATFVARADGYLPLPESAPHATPPAISTPAVDALAARLEQAADQLDALGLGASDPASIHDRHKAALCVRNVAVALRNAAAPDERRTA